MIDLESLWIAEVSMKHPGPFHRPHLPNGIGCSNEACGPEATLSDHTPGAAYS